MVKFKRESQSSKIRPNNSLLILGIYILIEDRATTYSRLTSVHVPIKLGSEEDQKKGKKRFWFEKM